MASVDETQEPAIAEVPVVADSPASDPASDPSEDTHRVQPGESWQTIADAHGVSVESLYALNGAMPHFSERSVTVGATVQIR